jgi:anaerobic sulfite reductase subunit B
MTVPPLAARVLARRRETRDTWTLELQDDAPRFAPGQFAMLYAFGVGEVPISVSGGRDPGGLLHTIRAVGATSRALFQVEPGRVLGVRGPFGTGWPVPAPVGADLVIVASGLGLAPLRPVVHHTVADRHRYGSVAVLVGSRTPEDLLYPGEYAAWRAAGLDVFVTVDQANAGWTGRVGLVTALYDRLTLRPADTVAYVCGPEIMMRFAARGLVDLGVPADRVWLSLERNMQCGVGHCGHCQVGPLLVCRGGPVVRYEDAESVLSTKEL